MVQELMDKQENTEDVPGYNSYGVGAGLRTVKHRWPCQVVGAIMLIGFLGCATIEIAANEADRIPTYKFDFGSKQSPLWPGFIRVTKDSMYNEDICYGWSWIKELEEGSTTKYGVYPDPLGADWIKATATFSTNVPNGKYKVLVMLRNIPARREKRFAYWIGAEGQTLASVDVRGKDFFKKYVYRHLDDDYRQGNDVWEKYIAPAYKSETFTVIVSDERLDLLFHPCQVTALIIYRADKAVEVETEIARMKVERKKSFPYVEIKPERRKLQAISDEDKKRGYVIFAKNYLDKVYPNTVPQLGEIRNELNAFATLGEYEPVTFAVYPLKDLKAGKVRVEDLISSTGDKISRENIEVRVVRYMERPSRDSSHYTVEPLLLQKREEVDIDFTGTKQFWLTIHIPSNARPGEYKGKVLFQPANAPSQEITLKLLVLPFKLTELEDRYQGMYHFYHKINEFYNIREQAIEDLKNHGYNLIWIASRTRVKRLTDNELGFDFEDLETEMELYRKHAYPGFKAKVLVLQNGLRDAYRLTNEPFGKVGDHQVKESFSKEFNEVYKQMAKAIDEKAKEEGWPEVLFYPTGEAGSEGQKGIETCMHLLNLLKQAGVKTHTSINTFSSYQLLPWLDTAAVNDGMHIDKPLIKKLKEAGTELWLYNIGNNRFVRGFYFWKTGARGMVREGYIWRKADPYNELYREDDEWRNIWWDMRPSPEGPVPTLNWEWAREGIDDSKYINTLITLITEAKKSSDSEIIKEAKDAEEMLNQMMEYIKPELSYYTKVVGYWKNDVYDKLRWRIAQSIMKLQSLLSKEATYKIEVEEDVDIGAAKWWNNDYRYRVAIIVNSWMYERKDCLIRQVINFTELLTDLAVQGTFDNNSIRVVEYNPEMNVKEEVPSQFNKDREFSPTAKAKGTLVWMLGGITPTLSQRYYYIYFDIVENGLKPALTYLRIPEVDKVPIRNLVSNPGFEIANKNRPKWPMGWNAHTREASPGSNRRLLTDEEAHTGKYSVKCISDVPKGDNGFETDYFSIKPNKKYLISFWAKVVDTNRGYGAVGFLQFYDKDKRHLGWKKRIQVANRGTYDWAKLIVSGISPSGAYYGKMQIFSSYGKSTAYFDDVEVREVVKDEMALFEVEMGAAERITEKG